MESAACGGGPSVVSGDSSERIMSTAASARKVSETNQPLRLNVSPARLYAVSLLAEMDCTAPSVPALSPKMPS